MEIYNRKMKHGVKRGHTCVPFSLLAIVLLFFPQIASAAEARVHLRDHLGNVVKITNEKGVILQKNVITPYGEISRMTDVNGDPITINESTTKRLFTGHYYDQESDLHYMNARYYDVKSKRFASLDPSYYGNSPGKAFSGIEGSTMASNAMMYVNGMATTRTDPTGLNPFKWIKNLVSGKSEPGGKTILLGPKSELKPKKEGGGGENSDEGAPKPTPTPTPNTTPTIDQAPQEASTPTPTPTPDTPEKILLEKLLKLPKSTERNDIFSDNLPEKPGGDSRDSGIEAPSPPRPPFRSRGGSQEQEGSEVNKAEGPGLIPDKPQGAYIGVGTEVTF